MNKRYLRELIDYAAHHPGRWVLFATLIILFVIWFIPPRTMPISTLIAMDILMLFGYLGILNDAFIPKFNEEISNEIRELIKRFQGITPRIEGKKLIFENEDEILELEIIEYYHTRREWP
ncbi:MAG: hypothetical protein GXO25_01700 [Euryarchaeota archaeon]|nr:hypothetical protein [Euryarchaeota archaeon]